MIFYKLPLGIILFGISYKKETPSLDFLSPSADCTIFFSFSRLASHKSPKKHKSIVLTKMAPVYRLKSNWNLFLVIFLKQNFTKGLPSRGLRTMNIVKNIFSHLPGNQYHEHLSNDLLDKYPTQFSLVFYEVYTFKRWKRLWNRTQSSDRPELGRSRADPGTVLNVPNALFGRNQRFPWQY